MPIMNETGPPAPATAQSRALAHDLRNLLHGALFALENDRGGSALESARDAIAAAHALLVPLVGPTNGLPRPVAKDVLYVLDLWCGTGTGGPIALEVTSNTLIAIDRWTVRRALLNLLLNARAASAQDAPIGVEVAQEQDQAVIRVRDVGRGISAEDLQKIRSKTPVPREEGHGVGLHGTSRALEAVGGRLELESSISGGTTATIRLPALGEALGQTLSRTEERSAWTEKRPPSRGSF